MNIIETVTAARMRYVVVLSALFALFAVPMCAQHKDMLAKHDRVIITVVTIKPYGRLPTSAIHLITFLSHRSTAMLSSTV